MKEYFEFILNLLKQGHSVCTDSRNPDSNSIFFALKGDNHNGNDYAKIALESGCKYAIVDEELSYSDNNIIRVDNVLNFLQTLANKHRQKFNIPIIAITGSNGKTTTKELVARVLSTKYNVLYTKGNLNNQIGTPLTLLNLNSSHQIAVIEIGANQPGEIALLSNIVNPTHGIITNIGKAHLEGFKNLETVIETKAALYNHLIKNGGYIFQRGENEILRSKSQDYNKTITYGNNASNNIQGNLLNTHLALTIEYKSNATIGECKSLLESTVNSNLTGQYNFENILSSIAIGLFFGVSIDKINSAITSYIPDNSRSQIIEGNNLIFMDAYNANPTSMIASLESFITFGKPPKVLILGDMLEMGNYAFQEHQNIIKWISEKEFHDVILIGKEFFAMKSEYPNYRFFIDSKEALAWLNNQPIKNCTILIKGSRGIKLEVLLNSLT
jgi:UDP-N-acetylmuramoyl-tripeptide--D-alanyl-D-alanine ligase